MTENSNKKIKVVYIAGYGRSGSTLLAMLLNSIEGLVNVGEIVKLFRYKEVEEYDFWKGLRDNSLKETGLGAMAGKKYASYVWYFFKFKKGLHLFQKIWTVLLVDIKKHFDASILVDASKSTRGAFSRPIFMKKSNVDIKVVHVVRNPFGVMSSFEKGKNHSNQESLKKGKKGGAYRALLSWFFINSLVSIVYKRHFKKNELYFLSYDKLTRNYEQEINKLFTFLELEIDENLLNEEIVLSKDLSFSGNRMRLNESIKIHPSISPSRSGFSKFLTGLLSKIYTFIEPNYEK